MISFPESPGFAIDIYGKVVYTGKSKVKAWNIITGCDMIKELIQNSPEKAVQPFMRIRQYVASIIIRAEGENVKLASSRELCRMFNVTRPTVQKALKQLIEDGDLIFKPGMGIFVNTLRNRNIRMGMKKARKVCIVFHSGGMTHLQPYFWDLFHESGCYMSENNVLMQFISLSYKGEKGADEISLYQPDGVLWFMPPEISISTIKALVSRKMPLVIVNQDIPGMKIDSVKLDYEKLGYLAGKYFIKKRHKQVLFVAKEESGAKLSAYKGFEKAFCEENRHDVSRVVFDSSINFNKEIRNYYKYGDGFSGIFTFASYFTNICEGIKAAGKNLAEIDIVTQNTPQLKFFPELKPVIIREPLGEIGRLAAEKLIKKITEKSLEPVNITMYPELEL